MVAASTSSLTSALAGTKPVVKSGISGESENALSQLSKNSDTFLKLLTTQLQHQDPLSPQDPTQFTSQLVQFTGVEQAIKTNQKLDKLIESFSSSGIGQALSYIGHTIEAKGDRTELVQGRGSVAYSLDKAAESAQIAITDSAGALVSVFKGTTAQGLNRLDWKGVDSNGKALPDGSYGYTVIARDKNGNDLPAVTRTVGVVEGAEPDAKGNINLSVAGRIVPVSDVLAIRDATV